MSEQSYPISCKSCGKQLYGPVIYCPYCAMACAVAPTVEVAEQSTELNQAAEEIVDPPSSDSVSVQQPSSPKVEPPFESSTEQTQKVVPETKPQEQISEPVSEKKSEKTKAEPDQPERLTPKSSGNLKWVAIAVILVVGIAGYLISHKKGGPSSEPPSAQRSSSSATKAEGKNDSVRLIVQDVTSQGVGLSMAISKLPKLEKVLIAAKQLGDISSNYREQVESAQKTLNSARKDRDKYLMAYLSKLLELTRYSPDQVAYALDTIKSNDATAREKIVAELVSTHSTFLRGKSKPNPDRILSDFNRRFSELVD